MSKLYLYTAFHANLNYSYIAPDLYPQILERCYWPLLRLIEDRKLPLGLEFSAYTLEVINSLDPSFTGRLRRLWEEDLCEVIGSGYTQSVMPLIPAKVNRKNLELGNEVYEKLLGRRPSTAMVNELVYSGGLPRLYQDAGYENIIVNWDSTAPYQIDQELLYRPCKLPVGETGWMTVVWHSLLAYRNFQRHFEGEITRQTFMDRLLGHMSPGGERAYPLYCSDWEVFDFKPWRVYPPGFQQPKSHEMSKVADLLDLLASRDDIEILTPSTLVHRIPPEDVVSPQTAEHPLPYKKQSLHSVGRWAIGGRSAVQNNTLCHQLYQRLSQADWQIEQSQETSETSKFLESKLESNALWIELCFLWNSDFRTFTTEEKHQEFQRRMGSALERSERLQNSLEPTRLEQNWFRLTNFTPDTTAVEPASLTTYTSCDDYADLETYQLELNEETVPCQVTLETVINKNLKKLTLEALPRLEPHQSAVGVVKVIRGLSADHDEDWEINCENHRIVTPSVIMSLLPRWGGTLESLTFPNVSTKALIHRGQEMTSDPVWSTDNLFAGDLILRDQYGRTITDHQPAYIEYPALSQNHEIFIPVRCSVQTVLGTIWKTYRVYINQPRVDLIIRFQWRDAVPRSFRLGTMSLNASAWDKSSLYYATTNGGEEVERFSLAGHSVGHGTPMLGDVTSSCCIGATEAWTVVGDARKGVGLITRPAELYSVPMVNYEESPIDSEAFLLSLTHTVGEWDETSHNLWRGHSTWTMSILAGNEEIIETTRASARLSNGGLTVRSLPAQ